MKINNKIYSQNVSANSTTCRLHVAHLRQQCHNSKCVIF